MQVQTAMSKIDTRKARAFKPNDQAMIHKAVEESASGFTAVNGRIHDRLRDWLADAAGELLSRLRREKGDRDKVMLTCMGTVANLLRLQGKLGEAEPLYVEALRGFRETLGDTHPDTLGSIHNLANLLMGQGKLDEAETLHLQAL